MLGVVSSCAGAATESVAHTRSEKIGLKKEDIIPSKRVADLRSWKHSQLCFYRSWLCQARVHCIEGKATPRNRSVVLGALGAINIGAGAKENFGGIHQRLRKRGMWMNSECDVFGESAHFDGQHSLGDEFACACADDSYAQYALGLRIYDQLGHAFSAVDSHGPARSRPGKSGDFDLAILFLGLSFREPTPGDFWIGEDDGGDGVGFESDFVSGDGFCRSAAFVHGFVGQHGLADDVADRVDGGVVGLQLLVDLDESALADFDLSFFQAGNFRVRFASDRNQNFVENFLTFFYFGTIEGDADSVGLFFHGTDGYVKQD